jgi:hypothetical protein
LATPGQAAGRAALDSRLRQAAQVIADDAKVRAARWSRRMPLSVRITGGVSRGLNVVGGGARAPQYYTFEGKPSGAPRSHPVYARGPRSGWTWVAQPPRPTLRPAAEAKADEVARIVAQVIDDWAHEDGFK